MHKIQMYENLRDMLEREVKEIEKQGNLNPQTLDYAYKLTCTIKNIDKCIEKEEKEMVNMSRDSYGYSRNAYRGNSRGSYGSYGSYGMSNTMMDRDNDGRYSEDNFRYSQNRGRNSGERSYGYSRDAAKESMMNRLMQMADNSGDENERMAIMDCIDRIR